MNTRPLAVFGGTFDPIHIGHLTVAWEAAELLDAEVRLMPANVPPHRASPQASPAERVAMLRAALAGQSRLVLDARELAQARDAREAGIVVVRRVEVEGPRLVAQLAALRLQRG